MIAFNYFCIFLYKQLVVVSEMSQIKIYKFQTAPLVCSLSGCGQSRGRMLAALGPAPMSFPLKTEEGQESKQRA